MGLMFLFIESESDLTRCECFSDFLYRLKAVGNCVTFSFLSLLLSAVQESCISNEPMLTYHVRKCSGVTDNMNNGSALFMCSSK